MMIEVDVIIIGAGPAGMSAAHKMAEANVNVLLLDEQSGAGGQIYRNVEHVSSSLARILGSELTKGIALAQALTHKNIRHIKDATVWQIEENNQVAFTVNGVAYLATGKRIVIATGALERPMPIPGWTLPGVMTAGAAQILLKQSAMVFEDPVLVGSGPLLYLIAAQMCRAGTPPMALVETQTRTDFLSSMRYGFGAVRGWRYLATGLSLLTEIRRARVKRYLGASTIKIEGDSQAEGVCFSAQGARHSLQCGTILLHHGVIPNTQIARSIDISHHWNAQQHSFAPELNQWGRSSVSDVFIAGDGSGIGGGVVASIAGQLVALEVLCDLNACSLSERDRTAVSLRHQLKRELSARPFIDRSYPPFKEALSPSDDTIVCRCEEVSAGEIRHYAKMGCIGPNQTKAFSRVGMGPCQGRYCGVTVTHILSEENDQSHDKTGYYRIRPPLKPVTLGEIAALTHTKQKGISE